MNLERGRGAPSRKMKDVVNLHQTTRVPPAKTNFHFYPPLSMKNYFWSRKSAAPAKKINKYSIFYRNEGKNYNKQNIQTLCINYDLHFDIVKVYNVDT